MEFVTRDIMKPIMDFIKTCPFLDKYNIDVTPSSVQKLVTAKPDGSALDYVGSMAITDSLDVQRNRRCNRQANFQLWLLRKSGYNVQRQEIADFLFNFEQWVEYSQWAGLCPKISNTQDDQEYEVMSADNGVYFSEWEDGSDASLYLVQLHINYYNSYYDEEDY